jgi:FlaA1/EpsC-like NDP-sugar epimerase
LRPGEKLFEELSASSDKLQPTHHEKIMIFSGAPTDYAFMEAWLAKLRVLVSKRDDLAVLSHMAQVVPEYQPSGKWQSAMRTLTLKAAAGD